MGCRSSQAKLAVDNKVKIPNNECPVVQESAVIETDTPALEKKHTKIDIPDVESSLSAQTPHELIKELETMREEAEAEEKEAQRNELDGTDMNRGLEDVFPPINSINDKSDPQPLPGRSGLSDDVEGVYDHKGYYVCLAVNKANKEVSLFYRMDVDGIPDSYLPIARADTTTESPSVAAYKLKKGEKLSVSGGHMPGTMLYFLDVYKQFIHLCMNGRYVMTFIHQPCASLSVTFAAFNCKYEPFVTFYKTNNEAALSFKDSSLTTKGILLPSSECSPEVWRQFQMATTRGVLEDDVHRHFANNPHVIQIRYAPP